MSKKEQESVLGDEHTALSNVEDASSGSGGGSPAATSSRKMRQRKPNRKQQEECNTITVAVPADIVGDVLKRVNPREAVRLSSVCRYWRAPALACNPTLRPTPWMIELTQSDNRLHFRLRSITDASVFVKLNPVYCFPRTSWWLEDTWHGWLLLSQNTPTDLFFLLNPFSRVRIDLPPYPLRDILCITSDPAAPGCAVIARDYFSNLMVCRPGDGYWTMGAGVCRFELFSRIVWLKEQLFVLNPIKKQLLTLQLFPLWCKDIVLVSFSEDLDFIDLYLVESQGDLLYVSLRSCVNMSCELFRVFRLDWDTMAFVAVDSLGTDRVVFLGGIGESISVSALEAGCAADCIYFRNTWGFLSGHRFAWHCYNLKKRTLESVPNRPMPEFRKSLGNFWIIPNVKNNYSHF